MSKKNKERRQQDHVTKQVDSIQEDTHNTFPITLIVLLGSLMACVICSQIFMGSMFTSVNSLIDNEHFYLLRNARLITIILAVVLGGCIIWKWRKVRFNNWLLASYTTLVMIAFAEIALMYTPLSDGVGSSDNYGYVLWDRKYGYDKTYPFEFKVPTFQNPIQVMFRKNPFPGNDRATFCSKKEVVVVGDSYAYGDGIFAEENTFAGVLENRILKLDSDLYVANLGVRGLDSYQEFDVFASYCQIASKYQCQNLHGIIWSYCFNDIEPTAAKSGYYPKFQEYPQVDSILGLFKKSSFIGNFVYWSVTRSLSFHDTGYKDFLRQVYSNSDLVRKTIDPILTVRKSFPSIPLTVTVFPVLQDDLKFSDTLYQNLYGELKRNNIAYMRVGEITEIQKLSSAERIVSTKKPHPSEAVHRIVGETLAKLFLK